MKGSLSRQRLQAMMVTFFAAAALLLTILGIYGVMAYSVRQRLTELGARMAVGAAPRDLLGLVLGEGFRMGAIGIAVGLLLVLGFAHVLATSDLQVEISGPFPFIVATVVTLGCTLAACGFQPGARSCFRRSSPFVAMCNPSGRVSVRLTSC